MKLATILIFAVAVLLAGSACTEATKPLAVSNKPAAEPKVEPHTDDGHDASRISLADAKKDYDAGNAVIVDVRDVNAYKQERIKSSLNITIADIDANLDKLPKGKKIIAYCSWREEHSSASWVAALKKKGLENAFALIGGTQAWKDAGYPMEGDGSSKQ